MGKKNRSAKQNITPDNRLHEENIALMTSLPQTLVYVCVAAILFMMPLWIDVDLKHVFNTAKEILFGRLLMVALIGWVLYLAGKGKFLIPKTRAFYLYFATILFMIVSITWSVSADLSIREIGPQLGCFLLFTIVLTTVRSEKVIQWLITISIWSALLVTLYGLFQYYDLDDVYFQRQQRTTVVDTLVGEVVVPAGESVMSRVFPFVSAGFFQRILLPQKPEEHFKIYAFMGHRNYFSGFLVLILPLVVIRLMLKLHTMIFEDFLKQSRGNTRTKIAWDLVTSAFYSICMITMSVAVLLTQTRGAMFGMMVGLCFLVMVSMLLANPKRYSQVVQSVFLGVSAVVGILALMFLTGTKQLFGLAVLVAALCFFGFIVFFRHLVHPLVLAAVAVILFIGSYNVIISPAESGWIKSRRSTVERIVQTSDWKGSAHQRTLIYSTTLRIITDDLGTFLFGKGIGTFGIHYMIYQVKLFLDTEVSGKFLWDTNKSIYAHNEYIHWWSEIGLSGITLFLLFWYFYINRVLVGVRRLYVLEFESNPLKIMTILALVAGTIGTLTHCIVTFDLHLMYSMVTFYCWAAFALVLVGVRLKEVDLPVLTGRLPLVAAGFLVAIYIFVRMHNIYQRDYYWRLAFYKFSLKEWTESFKLYQQALQHDSTLGELLFDFGRVMMDSNDNPRIAKADIDHYNVRTIKRNLNKYTMFYRPDALKEGQTLPPNEELTDKNLTNNYIAVSSFLEATHNFTDPANFHNIALCFYKESQRRTWTPEERATLAKKSEDYYQKAIDLNPIYAQSLSNLGYLKALRNEHDDAYSMLQRAVMLKDGKTPTTYLGLAVIHEGKREFVRSLDMFLRLLSRNPGNVDTMVRIGALCHRIRSELKEEELIKDLESLYADAKEWLGDRNRTFNEGDLNGYMAMLLERLKLKKDLPGFIDHLRFKVEGATVENYYETKLNSKKYTIAKFREEMGIWAEDFFLMAARSSQNKMQSAQFQRQALQFKIPRLQNVVKADPKNQQSYLELAFAFVQYGSLPMNLPNKEQYLQQGITALRRLIAQNPNNVEVRLKLAEAYAEINDVKSLRVAYQNVLKIMSPTDPRRGVIERKLLLLNR